MARMVSPVRFVCSAVQLSFWSTLVVVASVFLDFESLNF